MQNKTYINIVCAVQLLMGIGYHFIWIPCQIGGIFLHIIEIIKRMQKKIW